MEILNRSSKLVPVGELSPHPDNPRQGDVGAIHESIKANGFFGALVAQKSTGHVLVGNHRLQAALAAGIEKVPVMWVDVDDDRARRILLADNRTSDLSDYDRGALAGLLSSLATESLEGTGYDGEDLDRLISDLQASDPIDLGIDADPVEAPDADPGLEASHVRMVQLFLDTDTQPQFIDWCDRLGRHLDTHNITDTVYAVVKQAHDQLA